MVPKGSGHRRTEWYSVLFVIKMKPLETYVDLKFPLTSSNLLQISLNAL